MCAAIMSVEFFMHLFISSSVCNYFNLLFYDWRECVMSVLDTTKHSLCSYIDTWQQSCVVLLEHTQNTATTRYSDTVFTKMKLVAQAREVREE